MSGALNHNAALSLALQSGPDFSITALPSPQTVGPTGSASYTVLTNAVNGFSGSVYLSAGALPAGAAAVFNPPTVQAGQPSVLTVTTAASTPLGAYTIPITGTNGGSLNHATGVVVTVGTATPASMLTPPPGGTIPGGPTTFTWNSGLSATEYSLQVGSTPGGGDYYSGGNSPGQSATVTLPSTSQAVYATLSSLTPSGWQQQTYTYQINPQPNTQPLQLQSDSAPTPLVAGGPEVQVSYTFQSGDATTLASCTTPVAGVGVRIASLQTNAAVLGFRAALGTTAQTAGVSCQTLSGASAESHAGSTAMAEYVISEGNPILTGIQIWSSVAPWFQAVVGIPVDLNLLGENMGESGTVYICGRSGCLTQDYSTGFAESTSVDVDETFGQPGVYEVYFCTEDEYGDGDDECSGDLDVTVDDAPAPPAPAPALVVTWNGATVAPGGTVYINPDASASTVTVTVSNAQPGDTVTYSPSITFSQTMPDCSVQAVPGGFPYGPWPPYSGSQVVPFTVSPFGNRGLIQWSYNDVPQPNFTFNVLGQNPSTGDYTAFDEALNAVTINGTPAWFTRNIAIHETSEAQFWSLGITDSTSWCSTNRLGPLNNSPQQTGMPVYGEPGGYGILQLDPPVAPVDIWNWTQNILDWQSRFAALAGPEVDTSASLPRDPRAYPFWIRQVLQWQSYNNSPVGQPVPWPGDPGPKFSPNCTFQVPSPTQFPPVRNTGQPSTYWYGDAILMLQIAGVAPTGANYVSWNNSDPAAPYWSFNKANGVKCDVVYEFCTCTSVSGPGNTNCLSTGKPPSSCPNQ